MLFFCKKAKKIIFFSLLTSLSFLSVNTVTAEPKEETAIKPDVVKIQIGKNVKKHLSDEITQLIKTVEKVEAFVVLPDLEKPGAENSDIPKEHRIVGYLMKEKGKTKDLTNAQIKKLQNWLLSDKSYIFESTGKRCLFSPKIALRLIRRDEKLDLLFSFGCEMWLFAHQSNKPIIFDFSPITDELKAFRIEVFPPSLINGSEIKSDSYYFIENQQQADTLIQNPSKPGDSSIAKKIKNKKESVIDKKLKNNKYNDDSIDKKQPETVNNEMRQSPKQIINNTTGKDE